MSKETLKWHLAGKKAWRTRTARLAARKAVATRRSRALAAKRSQAAYKAWKTRRTKAAYSPKFDEVIRKKQPQWFEENKKKLLAMPKGSSRPIPKSIH